MKDIFEKLGLFYLGKDSADDTLTLYKAKYLTTHAAIIGMTGSGKTGLGIGLIEEAALDNIPSIVIDPKGDMGNLCLNFPDMRAEDFEPWLENKELAQEIAQTNLKGIESFGQDKERIKRLSKVKKTIYTPGSSAGVGINILGNFEAPNDSILEDQDTFISLINTTVSSLLSLVSIKDQSTHSKEHLLVSNILHHFWTHGISLDIEKLIEQVVTPPFQKVGVLSLSSFYPQNERMKLATLFNNLISSIGFSSWIQGENLDIQNLLYDEDGKATIAIISISHLNDQERMFFITLLLNKYISWMRKQSGSSTLKSILYMDEIFGFFPPSKNPPSKEPMLLLLKQARAFGTGIILSTQNPVDIDYKGLSNIGTWFIGKLQTPQDIERVVDGISAKSTLSKKQISDKISTLKGRHFFLKSAHLDSMIEFYTRWVLSYLKGPMSKNEIKKLNQNKTPSVTSSQVTKDKSSKISAKPILPESIKQYYLDSDKDSKNGFYPYLYAELELRFFNQKRSIDTLQYLYFKIDIDNNVKEIDFTNTLDEEIEIKNSNMIENGLYHQLSPLFERVKSLKSFEKSLSDHIYYTKRLELFSCKSLKLESTLEQTKPEFLVEVQNKLNEQRDLELEKLETKFEKKYKSYEDKFAKLQIRLEKEEADVSGKLTDTIIGAGLTLLGAFFGKSTKRSSINKGVSTLRKGRAVLKEKDDVEHIKRLMAQLEDDVTFLEENFEEDLKRLEEKFSIENYPITPLIIKPRRKDIIIKEFALLWER